MKEGRGKKQQKFTEERLEEKGVIEKEGGGGERGRRKRDEGGIANERVGW